MSLLSSPTSQIAPITTLLVVTSWSLSRAFVGPRYRSSIGHQIMMLMMSAFVPILLLPFLLLMIDPCVCFSATIPRRSTPVLFPSEAGDSVHLQFDVGCVANPVVLLPSSLDQDSKWQMYYYGNAGSWNHEIKCFLPTGWSGLVGLMTKVGCVLFLLIT